MAKSYGTLLTEHEKVVKDIAKTKQAINFTARQIHTYEVNVKEYEEDLKHDPSDARTRGMLEHCTKEIAKRKKQLMKLRKRLETDLRSERSIEEQIKKAGGTWVDRQGGAADRARHQE